MSIVKTYSRFVMMVLVVILAGSLAGCFDGSSSNKDVAFDESSGIKDADDAGNNTANGEDTVAPAFFSVTSTAPEAGEMAVDTNTKVVATFNKAVNAATIDDSSYTLRGAGEAAVTGNVTVNAATKTASFSHSGLTAGVTYTATITKAAQDLSGLGLAEDVVWTFTTATGTAQAPGTEPDPGTGESGTAPVVNSTNPISGAQDVLRNAKITVSFSNAIDPDTVTAANFMLVNSDAANASVAGALSYLDTKTVVFTPNDRLAASNLHTFTLTTAIKDIAGKALAVDHVITFTTAEIASTSPEPVSLGTAGDYVILAKTGISTTGVTAITGNIAVSPIDLTAITGFALTREGTFATSSIVTGQVFAADLDAPTPTDLTAAVGAMQTAYTDAAGRSKNAITELGAGNISGMTLEPGLYQWGTGLQAASDVTLNGDANAVWIFQVAQDLKLQDGVAVRLEGGALPKNIFWQVAGSVTLQAGVSFNGIILGQTNVAMKSGATVNGRVLAQTGVTLIGNTIVQP